MQVEVNLKVWASKLIRFTFYMEKFKKRNASLYKMTGGGGKIIAYK